MLQTNLRLHGLVHFRNEANLACKLIKPCNMFDTFWKWCKPFSLENQPFSDFRNRAIPKGWKVSGPGAGRSVCSVLEVCETMFLAAQNQKSDPEHQTIRIELKLYVSRVHSGRPPRTHPGSPEPELRPGAENLQNRAQSVRFP